MQAATTIRVRVNPRNFNNGLKAVKRMGGRFNGEDKTWSISADRPEVRALNLYYLLPVTVCSGCGSAACFDGE